jgi:hypothetical protein
MRLLDGAVVRKGEMVRTYGLLFSDTRSLVSFIEDFDNLLDRCVLELLAAELKGRGESDGGILHALVRLLGTANEKEMITSGEALVSVLIVQPHTEETHDATLGPISVICHCASPRMELRWVSAYSNIRQAEGTGQAQPGCSP